MPFRTAVFQDIVYDSSLRIQQAEEKRGPHEQFFAGHVHLPYQTDSCYHEQGLQTYGINRTSQNVVAVNHTFQEYGRSYIKGREYRQSTDEQFRFQGVWKAESQCETVGQRKGKPITDHQQYDIIADDGGFYNAGFFQILNFHILSLRKVGYVTANVYIFRESYNNILFLN